MAASLGSIKWGVQYSAIPNGGDTAKSKTISGLNLNDATTAEAQAENAAKAYLLISYLAFYLGGGTITDMNLIETREVNNNV